MEIQTKNKYSQQQPSKQQWKDEIVQDMLIRIRRCNTIPDEVRDTLLYFVVDGQLLGKVRPTFAERLVQINNSPFCIVSATNNDNDGTLTLSQNVGKTCEERTAAIKSVIQTLANERVISGWRNELLPVSNGFYDDPTFLIERAAAPYLGIQQYAVHINGFVRVKAEGGGNEEVIKVWMARRSRSKSKYPGMLDHMVAGAQPFGISITENVIKECGEEAGIPIEIAQTAKSVGIIQYDYCDDDGSIKRGLSFCYDLELPIDFVPTPVDGEVEEFFLWNMDDIAQSMRIGYEDEIKPTCCLSFIDFLVRHGYVTPECGGYIDVARELRS